MKQKTTATTEEIYQYYQEHSLSDTAKHFGITRQRIDQRFKVAGLKTRRQLGFPLHPPKPKKPGKYPDRPRIGSNYPTRVNIDVDLLREKAEEGYSKERLAALFTCSVGTIHRWMQFHKIKSQGWKGYHRDHGPQKATEAEVRALCDKGLAAYKIAQATHWNRKDVAAWMDANGYPRWRKPRKPKPSEEELRALVESGMSTRQIAKRYTSSHALAVRWIDSYGIPRRRKQRKQ